MKKRCLIYACVLAVNPCIIAVREWVDVGTHVSLYAPALLQSQATTVYYTGSYTSPTGNVLRSRKGYEALHPDHTHSFDFAEIAVDRSMVKQSWGVTMLLDILRGAKYAFLSFLGDVRMPRSVWSDPLTQYALDYTKVNIGQQEDIACLTRAYNALACDKDVVLFGFSRGAATICNFLCTTYAHQPHQRVKAAVMGGCFDSLESVFAQQAQASFILPCSWGRMVYTQLQQMLPSFGTHRKEPIDVIEQFPKHIPVLFISSRQDAVVPAACTRNLVRGLAHSGHKHVYYLELATGSHSRHYLNHADGQACINTVVHAFYKKYGCAYCPDLASHGEVRLHDIHVLI